MRPQAENAHGHSKRGMQRVNHLNSRHDRGGIRYSLHYYHHDSRPLKIYCMCDYYMYMLQISAGVDRLFASNSPTISGDTVSSTSSGWWLDSNVIADRLHRSTDCPYSLSPSIRRSPYVGRRVDV